MTQNSSEPRESLAPGVREQGTAAGEADAIVWQAALPREVNGAAHALGSSSPRSPRDRAATAADSARTTE